MDGTETKTIEALLFMSPKAVSIEDLKKTLAINDEKKVEEIALNLMGEFNSRDSSLEIIRLEGSFQMKVKAPFDEKVGYLAKQQLFHKGVMKTLALIAFKQPIKQSDLVKYRNVKAYDHIAKLLEEGFITKESKGKTYIVKTTRKFLDYFGADYLKEDKSKSMPDDELQT